MVTAGLEERAASAAGIDATQIPHEELFDGTGPATIVLTFEDGPHDPHLRRRGHRAGGGMVRRVRDRGRGTLHTSHADQLVDMTRDLFGQGDAFVAKITGKVDRPLQRIREFRNRPKPAVVVTVDLLTPGIDIPDLEFLVFLRPVKSRILFEQMLGRGTRKGEKYPDKSHFVVFDCFDGTLLEYFRSVTCMTAEPPEADGKAIAQIIEEIWNNQDRDYSWRSCSARVLVHLRRERSGRPPPPWSPSSPPTRCSGSGLRRSRLLLALRPSARPARSRTRCRDAAISAISCPYKGGGEPRTVTKMAGEISGS